MKQFSPILDMEALARALGVLLKDVQHAVIHHAPENIVPGVNGSADTTFNIQPGTCLLLAYADLVAFPMDVNGVPDFSFPMSGETISGLFELMIKSNGRTIFRDAEGTYRLDGPHVLVLPPGEYQIILEGQESLGELGYNVAYRLDGYLLPDEQAAQLRSSQTFIMGS